MPQPFTFDSGPAGYGRVNYDRIHVGRPLTDRQIAKYQKQGRYTKTQPYENRLRANLPTRRQRHNATTSDLVKALLH